MCMKQRKDHLQYMLDILLEGKLLPRPSLKYHMIKKDEVEELEVETLRK